MPFSSSKATKKIENGKIETRMVRTKAQRAAAKGDVERIKALASSGEDLKG